MMAASPAGSKGQMVNPASASSWRICMPRIEPVPTAPAPPIWKTDRGDPPDSCSVRRSRAPGCGGRLVVRPQNGADSEVSHDSPSRDAARQMSRPDVQPFAFAYQCGKPNAKSMPATSRPDVPRRRISSSRSSGRDRPFSRRQNTPSSTTAIHVVWPLSSARPDQSMATSTSSVTT